MTMLMRPTVAALVLACLIGAPGQLKAFRLQLVVLCGEGVHLKSIGRGRAAEKTAALSIRSCPWQDVGCSLAASRTANRDHEPCAVQDPRNLQEPPSPLNGATLEEAVEAWLGCCAVNAKSIRERSLLSDVGLRSPLCQTSFLPLDYHVKRSFTGRQSPALRKMPSRKHMQAGLACDKVPGCQCTAAAGCVGQAA